MKSIEDSTVKEIWKAIEEKLEKKKEPYAELNAVYEFRLLDHDDTSIFQLSFQDGKAVIYAKNEKNPDCILKMNAKNFKKFLRGELNSAAAFMMGKLKINGQIGTALKLENMLKHYRFD